MYIYTYVDVCVCVCVCVIHMHVWMCVFVFVYAYVYIYVYISKHVLLHHIYYYTPYLLLSHDLGTRASHMRYVELSPIFIWKRPYMCTFLLKRPIYLHVCIKVRPHRDRRI